MLTFYSTCAAGLERVASRMAAKAISGFQQRQILGGALIYSAKAAKTNCTFFQNTYLLLGRYERVRDMKAAADMACKAVSSDKKLRSAIDGAMRQYGFRSFRVMFSDANKLISVDPSIRSRMERAIQSAKVDRVHPDTELLVLRRTEGFALLLLRLTKAGNEKKPDRGELSQGIAQAMVFLARPTPDGVFLDPFAGHGALGAARKAIGPVKRIELMDVRPEPRKSGFSIAQGDALELSRRYEKASITELVTDPPWGLYEPLPLPADAFYDKLLSEFAYVLAPDGMLVLLTADKANYENALKRHRADFEPVERHDLLVNGKKAAMVVSRRIGERE